MFFYVCRLSHKSRHQTIYAYIKVGFSNASLSNTMSNNPQVVTTALVRIVVDATGGVEQALTRGPKGEVQVAEVSTSTEQQVTYLFKARRVDVVSLTNAFSGWSAI